MHEETCIHFLIGLTDLKLLHNSIINFSQFSRKNLGFSFSSLHSISSFSWATPLLVLDPNALKLQIAKSIYHNSYDTSNSGNNVWDRSRTKFPYAKPLESWSLPSDTQNAGFSSPRSSNQCKSQAIWTSSQSTDRRPHCRAVLTPLQLHSQRQEPSLQGPEPCHVPQASLSWAAASLALITSILLSCCLPKMTCHSWYCAHMSVPTAPAPHLAFGVVQMTVSSSSLLVLEVYLWKGHGRSPWEIVTAHDQSW